ncbi:MAG: DUF4145 domain-containing protein [Candidatus Thermoplasmatota archaeon]|nr:DUF4145 domain-containing protein [Candidatus Thermoplasmatota archaeon]
MALIDFSDVLKIDRCPFCNVDTPNLTKLSEHTTINSEGENKRIWRNYVCGRCGGVVLANAIAGKAAFVHQIFPSTDSVADDIPDKARAYLVQALESIHAPAGAIMLAASSVDAMLKAKKYNTGSLYSRIDQAAKDGIITKDMAIWAHQVRLEANDQRHADENADLPKEPEAKKCIDFAKALGQFMFVLPALVAQGLKDSKPQEVPTTT